MKFEKILIIILLSIPSLLTACSSNQRGIVESDDLDETEMIEFVAINFNELDEFFKVFLPILTQLIFIISIMQM